jgi:hypothetical protein
MADVLACHFVPHPQAGPDGEGLFEPVPGPPDTIDTNAVYDNLDPAEQEGGAQ